MKIKNAIFNVVVYSMLGWSIFSATYVALPPEIQTMLPDMNWLTALVSGSSTAIVGSAGLLIKSFLTKARTEANTKYLELGTKFLEITNKYTELEQKYTDVINNIKRTTTLIETDLKSKLSNPLIDEEVKSLIEGVLDEQEG